MYKGMKDLKRLSDVSKYWLMIFATACVVITKVIDDALFFFKFKIVSVVHSSALTIGTILLVFLWKRNLNLFAKK